MRAVPLLAIVSLLSSSAIACGGTDVCTTTPAPVPSASAPLATAAPSEVARVLDELNDAASKADEERYFGLFAEGAVFLGTDGRERWTLPQFRAYAHPIFARGAAWSFRSTRREITFSGDVAWFDEDLDTPNLGPARGSGVVVRDAGGRWKVAQYNLSVPIPNERFKDVRAAIDGTTSAPVAVATAEPPPPPNEPHPCVRARAARAANSPVAAALESQCRAAGGTVAKPPSAPSAATTAVPAPAPAPSVCAAARAARARNMPAAGTLEAQCRAAGGTP